MKLLLNYEKEGRPMDEMCDEDQFMLRFGKIPRLTQRINVLTFMGNFPETVKRLQPVSLSFCTAPVGLYIGIYVHKQTLIFCFSLLHSK